MARRLEAMVSISTRVSSLAAVRPFEPGFAVSFADCCHDLARSVICPARWLIRAEIRSKSGMSDILTYGASAS
jgi:hypothetical protein